MGGEPGPDELPEARVSGPPAFGPYSRAEPFILRAILWVHVFLVRPIEIPVLTNVAIRVDNGVPVVAHASPLARRRYEPASLSGGNDSRQHDVAMVTGLVQKSPKPQRCMGWKSSTKLPEGSTRRTCEPPGPVTMSFLN